MLESSNDGGGDSSSHDVDTDTPDVVIDTGSTTAFDKKILNYDIGLYPELEVPETEEPSFEKDEDVKGEYVDNQEPEIEHTEIIDLVNNNNNINNKSSSSSIDDKEDLGEGKGEVEEGVIGKSTIKGLNGRYIVILVAFAALAAFLMAIVGLLVLSPKAN